MKYRLKKEFSTDPALAISELLMDRGIKNTEKYIHPTTENENNPYDLENISEAADMLIRHLRADDKITIIIDCD